MIQLPELYSKHLKKQFSYPQYLILLILINLLQNLHTVRLEELARRFPVPIQLRSRIKKLQRFLSLEQFNIKTLWFPILSNWITTECSRGEVIYAVRGHWGIENSLHWVLDVAFGEDDCSIDRDHAPENLARLRKMALNLWSSEKTAKIGVAL